LTHGRGCTHAARPLETGPTAVDLKPRAFADRTNLKAKDIAAIGVEPRCRIVAGGDQLATQLQHRRAGGRGNAERGRGVGAGQFGAQGDGCGFHA
jgi:hypothetical protein